MSKNKKFYKGKKNKTINEEFINICKMTQEELKKFLDKELGKYYKNVISKDGFLYAKGKDKVCVTAHMDTVHKETIRNFYELNENGKHIVSSPQGIGGDDRCGVYMILKLLESGLRPTVLFCEDEEIGMIGASKFTKTKFIKDLEKMYFIIELDRKGGNNVVFYEDANEKWQDFVTKTTKYNLEYGSCSDISVLSPACMVSSCNIGCGYYNQHTLDEYVILEEMENSIEVVKNLINEGLNNKEKFKYEEEIYYKNYEYDDWYGYNYKGYSRYNRTLSTTEVSAYISWDNGYGEKGEDIYTGESVEHIFYNFFMDHPDISFNQITDYDIWDENFNSLTTLLSVI